MDLDSWLAKVRSAFATGLGSVRSTMSADASLSIMYFRRRENVSILAFEIASIMSKLLHLWRSLSDASLNRLRTYAINLPGVRKLVSDDDDFLLSLACAELTDAISAAAASISVLARRCTDPALRQFDCLFKDFADSGRDPHRWVMAAKEMEAKAKKMDRYVATTAALHKETDELAEAERALRKLCCHSGKVVIAAAADAQRRIFWQQQEVKYLRQISLWSCTFDGSVSILARSSFTILARIKQVFGIRPAAPHQAQPWNSSFVPSAVHPETAAWKEKGVSISSTGLMETSAAALMPPAMTLGAAGLAPHYAKVILVMERMMQAPRLLGSGARDELYGMLPASVRALLRARLRGVGRGAAHDAGLAEEWRTAMSRIIRWFGPVAHGTLRWHEERNFERRSAVGAPRANVLLLQTLYFANREKVEAAIAELLIGLNYVWRFEMEHCAKLPQSSES